VNYFKLLIENKKKSSIRKMMRGYRTLKERNELDLISKVKYDISCLRLNPKNHYFINHFSDSLSNKNFEIILRQYLIVRFANISFNINFLIAINNKKRLLIHPMPIEWRELLETYGFRCNTFYNKLVWNFYLILYFIHGIYKTSLYFFYGLFILLCDKKNNIKLKNSIYFANLEKNNFSFVNKKKNGVVSWFQSHFSDKNEYCISTHSVKNGKIDHNISYVYDDIPFPDNIFEYIIYFSFFLVHILFSLINWLRGCYSNLILFNDISKFFFISISKKNFLPNIYLFHNSNWIYKPLWTYAAEKKGVKIYFYFYATNVEEYETNKIKSYKKNFWHIISWNNFFVWNDYQKFFILRSVNYPVNFEIVGPISFRADNSNYKQCLPKNSIVIFDIQPRRSSVYQTLCLDNEYYISNTCCKFLLDIYNTATIYNFTVVLKQKRKIDSLQDKCYLKLINDLKLKPNFILINEDVAPETLITDAKLVISMPFTSTAIIAESLKKPSFFYDTNQIINKYDKAAHGIYIISGLNELSRTLKEFES
jgi:polysaccharide biosynthesis PFTS motif protein